MTERPLEDIIAGYLDQLDRGITLEPLDILAEHPERGNAIIESLREFMDIPSRLEETSLGTLGDYTLRRQIGRGGMGVVYEAWQTSLDRQVALKVLPAGIAADVKSSTRFLREAQIAARLNHPQIVPVYASGVEGHTPYYAMEHVEGETLAAVLSRLHEPDGEDGEHRTLFGFTREDVEFYYGAARAFAEVASGLQHAHSKGVIHRDIKPSNLILDARSGENGGGARLRILDFGLARLEGQETLTLSGDLMGTVLYMSPEQAQVRRIPLDHRTDIYSLGATLFETLTGQPPFRGADNHDTLSQILLREPPDPVRVNRRIPQDLGTIVLKCLRKDANARYGTAEALAQDLTRFVHGDPIEARPQPAWERVVARARRHRGKIAVAMIMIALVAVSSWFADQTRRAQYEVRRAGAESLVFEVAKKVYSGSYSLKAITADAPDILEFGPAAKTLQPLADQDFRHLYGPSVHHHPLARALTELASVAEELPEPRDAYYHLAKGCLFFGFEADAEKAVEKALRCDPRFVPARILRGESIETVWEEYRDTASWERSWLAARRGVDVGEWPAAIKAYGELIAHAKRDSEPYIGFAVDAYLGRGVALLETGDTVQAQWDFVRADLLELGGLEPGLLLGKACILEGNLLAAENAFEQLYSSTAEEHRDEAALWITAIYNRRREYAKGQKWAERLSEGIAIKGRLMSYFHFRLGQLEESIAEGREAIQRNPTDPVAHLVLASALRDDVYRTDTGRASKLAEFLRVSRRAVRLNPNSAWARSLLASAEGERDQAAHELSKEMAMKHPRTWGMLWTALLWLQSAAAGEQDPRIDWTTYFGGTGYDIARGLAVGPDGSIYVGGTTNRQSDLPEPEEEARFGELGGFDAVVLKLSPDGRDVLWKAVLGSPGEDVLFGLDLDSDGVVTISGRASRGFPTTTERTHRGGVDAFVARLDPELPPEEQLRYSTLLGGSGNEAAVGVGVDSAGLISIGGYTSSRNLPVTPGALLDAYQGGAFDLFVARLDPRDDSLVYSTYVGSPGQDIQTGTGTTPDRYYQIHVEPAPDDTVLLETQILSAGLPTTPNAYQRVHNGPENTSDVYVARIRCDSDISREAQLVYGSYVGTSGWDAAQGVAVDDDGGLLVLGYSWHAGFFTTPNAFDRQFGGPREGFLIRLDPGLGSGRESVTYSTFLGGDGGEYTSDVLVLPGKQVLVATVTEAWDYPVTPNAFQERFRGWRDVALTRLDLDPHSATYGQNLYSTYLGGPGDDYPRTLEHTPDGRVVLIGHTNSRGLGTEGVVQPDNAGDYDMFITTLDLDVAAPVFVRGDCDGSGAVNVSDATCTVNWLFAGRADPGCRAALNANSDTTIDLTDAVFVLNYLFAGGPAPTEPFPECAPGCLEADRQLGCASPLDCR